MPTTTRAVIDSLLHSFSKAERHEQPYRHWFLADCLPGEALPEIAALPFEAPSLGGVSGKREVHNATRKYFDAENRAKHGVVAAVAEGLQSQTVTDAVKEKFGTDIAGSYLRIEFAQDTDGFWLEPHTDLGVKLFTFLLYLSDDPRHGDLGTDIYDADKKFVGRSPFTVNGAMIFIPSNNTFHGFEPRTIPGVRKSLIINYVTNEWRAREQLAFPDQPVK
ncbi:MAG: 2OG-Fe(II) oxygenase [Hyphomicrobiaceae bacterium]|nr:2OG-Fe(II) oxygenase [Hyphomicrobiaceae bacterium]